MTRFEFNRGLIIVLIFSIILRGYILLLPQRSYGDALEHITIADDMLNKLEYDSEKYLPVYPILLLPPVYIFKDQHSLIMWYERLLNALLSIGGIICLYLIGREMRLNKNALIFGALFCSIHPFYLEQSTTPLNYCVYTFFSLLALLLFYVALNRQKDHLFFMTGIGLGLASMTRHEGFVLSGFILLYFMLKGEWKKLVYVITPLILLALPFFINNFLRYGSPIYTEYTSKSFISRCSIPYDINTLKKKICDQVDFLSHKKSFYINYSKTLGFQLSTMLWIFFTILIAIGSIILLVNSRLSGIPLLLYFYSVIGVSVFLLPLRANKSSLISPFLSLFLSIGFFEIEKLVKSFLGKGFFFISLILLLLVIYPLLNEAFIVTQDNALKGYRDRSDASIYEFKDVNTLARYVKIHLGDRFPLGYSRTLILYEVEIYSKDNITSLTRIVNGTYTYIWKHNINGTYSYSQPPDHGDNRLKENISFRSGMLSGLLDRNTGSVSWNKSGVRNITFDLKGMYEINRLECIYWVDSDTQINEGRWYASSNGLEWNYVGGWDDSKNYSKSMWVLRSINVSEKAHYIRLEVTNTKSSLILDDVAIITNDDVNTASWSSMPDYERELNGKWRIGSTLPLHYGKLTDGFTFGDSSRYVIWSSRNSGSVDIIFDLKDDYSINRIMIYSSFPRGYYGFPESTISVSLDNVTYTTVGCIPATTYHEVNLSKPYLPLWLQEKSNKADSYSIINNTCIFT